MSKLKSEKLILTIVAMLFFVLPFLGAVFLLAQEDTIPWRHSGLSGYSVRRLVIGTLDKRSVIYATSDEGIFRSDDGVHWQIINNGLPLELLKGITINTLVVDSHNLHLVYALVSNDENAIQLYRTTNGGDNWERLTLPSSDILDTMALFAGEPSALYILGSSGLYVSHDYGQSWTRRDTIPQDIQALALAVDPLAPGVLYLGTQRHGILRSEDEGHSWVFSQDNLDEQAVEQILVSPANPRVLFALVEQKLYRSFDAGQTWEFTSRELETQQITTLTAHPEQESVIYVGTAQGQVFITADTGSTWMALGYRLGDTSVRALALDQNSVRVATDNGLYVLNLELPPDVTLATSVAAPPSETPTPFLKVVENTDVSDTVPGKIEVKYPLGMNPSSSDFVYVQIYVPDQLVSIESVDMVKIAIPPDMPPIVGRLGLHQDTTPISDTMRVELFSPSFKITSKQPSVQPVKNYEINEPTTWSWAIKAPDTLGMQVLMISVYFGKDINPCWIGNIRVQVVEFTPTPSPTKTPINAVAIIFGIVLFDIVSLVGIYTTYQNNKRQNDTRELKAQMAKISQEKKYASVWATDAILEKDVSERKHLAELRQILATYFNKDELLVLCFDLGIDYENLSDKKSRMAMELVERIKRLGRTPELVKAIRQRRPDISWSHTPEVTEKAPPILQGIPPERLQKYKELEKKVKQLEAVKWWQFWR